jgi:hypothetical protein
MLEASDVVRLEFLLFTFLGVDGHGRVDEALVVEGVEDGAVEAVMGAEDLRQHGHGLLAPVFLVGGDEDDVLTFAWAFAAGISQPLGIFRYGMGQAI